MAPTIRLHRSGAIRALRAALWLLLAAAPSAASGQEFLDPSHPLHARLGEELRNGEASRPEALMLALRALFAPDELPAGYASLAADPIKCGTALLRAADDPRTGLPDADRVQIAMWRESFAARRNGELHLSSGGHFLLDYEVAGVDSIDATDLSPANGIPDYVEKVAEALEASWSIEVDLLGFDAPDTGGLPYEVRLRSIGAYGYTELDAMAPGGTRIVLRSNYEGVAPNEDPEGSEIGALRVTAAHEFRHAGQYATSGWSEPGLWAEVDAVWIEDQVFDEVNDYYRYLATVSPISDPQLPLDDGGSPSYAECIFEHWIQQRIGIEGIRQYWERRRALPAEEPLASYDAVLSAAYAPVDSAFVDFALFNLQTGALAGAGPGYAEAAAYPDARVSESAAALPASFGSAIDHLAAKFYCVEGFSSGSEEIDVRLRQPDGVQLRVVALAMLKNGSRLAQPLAMSSADETFRIDCPARDVESLYLIVANGLESSDAAWFFVDVEEVAPTPASPMPELDGTWTTLTVATGQVRDLTLTLYNRGPSGTSLDYTARALDPGPVAARGIENSVLVVDQLSYVPGDSRAFSIGVLNGGISLGFIGQVSLTLPAGVSVVGGSDIVSESGLTLAWDGFDPPSSSVLWIDGDGGFGSVIPGATGMGTVELAFDVSLTGPVVLDWTLDGDGFGGGVQQVTGQVLLGGPVDPRLEVLMPEPVPPGVVGQMTGVAWISGAAGDIAIELSRDDGQSWETLVASTPNDASWDWNVTGPQTDLARLRVLSGGQASAPSPRFDIVEAVPWATMLPASGTLASQEGIGLRLRVDATGLLPGSYPVRVDVRDGDSPAATQLDVTIEVVASPVDAPAPARTRILGVRPNPFNPATRLHFELATEAEVVAEVLDLRGRRVRHLLHTTLPAGRHETAWDGTDDEGRAVASGTYLWRLHAGDASFTGKLSLVR